MFVFPDADDPDGPAAILKRLYVSHEEMHEIASLEPKVAMAFRGVEKLKNGRMILGTCYIPQVQGELRPLFELLLEEKLGYWPDFLIVFDAGFWAAATPIEREALVFHEALHMGQAVDKYGTPRFDAMGNPVWGIRGHSIEEFDEVVRRYGAWSPDVQSFFDAAREGGVK